MGRRSRGERLHRRATMSEQYEVLAVRYGTRQASAAEVFLNYHAYREPDRPLVMDYFFWVAATRPVRSSSTRVSPRPAARPAAAPCSWTPLPPSGPPPPGPGRAAR